MIYDVDLLKAAILGGTSYTLTDILKEWMPIGGKHVRLMAFLLAVILSFADTITNPRYQRGVDGGVLRVLLQAIVMGVVAVFAGKIADWGKQYQGSKGACTPPTPPTSAISEK